MFIIGIVLLIQWPALLAPAKYDDIQFFLEPDRAEWNWKWIWLWHNRSLSRATLTATFKWVPEKYQLPAFHLTNSILHVLVSLLTGGIALQWSYDPVVALIASLVMAVSPLAVQAICPIATRSILVSAVFYLFAMILTLAGHPVMALPVVFLAIHAREDAIVLLPLLALIQPGAAVYILGIPALISTQFLRQIVKVVQRRYEESGTLGMKRAGMDESLPQPDYTRTAIAENICRWPFWNIGLWQNHDPKISPAAYDSWKLNLALIGSAAMVMAAAMLPHWRLPILLVLVSPWTASFLFPMPDVVADSRAYLTIPGLALAAASLPIPLALWPFALTVLTLAATWKVFLHRHPVPFWMAAWRDKKPKLRVAINIGSAFQNTGDLESAMTWHQKAIQVASTSGVAWANIALWHEGMARFTRREAANDLMMWGALDSDKAKLCHEQSIVHLTQALELMSRGLYYCGDDPTVQAFAERIRDHARQAGMTL